MQIQVDPEAWRGVEELPEFLRRVLRPRCRDESELDDVVQETCMRAARYRASLTDAQRLKPWAARIGLNVLANRVVRSRDERRRPLEDEPEAPPAGGEEESAPKGFRVGSWLLEQGEALSEMRAAMVELREEDRSLLHAFYGGGESCHRAAMVCELAPGLAKVRLFRARRRLLRLVRHRVALSARRWVDSGGCVHELWAPARAEGMGS